MKISRNIVSAVIISLMIGNTSLSVPSYADDLDDQLSDIQGQIDASRIEQANWEQVIEEVSTRLKGIQAELNAATARLREIQRQQAQINAR